MTVAKTETIPWDPVESLDSPEAQRAYLEAAFEDGDPNLVAAAIGDVARARGATDVARDAGLSRETIYKSLKTGGNPTLATIIGVLKALDLQLGIKPAN